MKSDVYWIEAPLRGRLAIMARPRAGDWLRDEIAGWASYRIDVVVSLLEPTEIAELDLGNEAALCREHGIDLISFPIADRGVPASLRSTAELAGRLAEQINEGKSIAVHCRAGIGRSAVLAGCVLVALGTEPGSALALISNARRLTVPDTEEQRRWLHNFTNAFKGEGRSLHTSGIGETGPPRTF
jgi:protein-tyrosine phosphatase